MNQSAGSARNPCLFVVGCPRSGTTLLKRMVDAHPEIAITRETHWIARFYRKRIGITSEGLVTPQLIPSLLKYHRFSLLGIDRTDLETRVWNGEQDQFADFVSRLFDLYGRRREKSLVGDKTPGYVRHIGLLHELWPRARFVHLIRDGRDVCLSMLDWSKAGASAGRLITFQEDPVSTTAFWWKRNVRLGRASGSILPSGLYHEVHYERLCEEPQEECRLLCRFLGVPFQSRMLQFHEGRTNPDPGLSPKSAFLPPTPGLRDWRQQMPREDVERFEAAAGDLLDDLGYERGISQPSPDSLVRAAYIRRQLSTSESRKW